MPPVATEMLPMVEHALDQSNGVLAVVERVAEAGGALVLRQVNGAFCRAFGQEATALEGQALAALTAPDEDAKVIDLTAAAARGEAHRAELLCRRADGNPLWLGLHLMPARHPAHPDGLFVLLARDITAPRRASEQQNAVQRLLATVFSAAEAGLSIVGQDGRFLMTNAFHDRMLGYEPGSLAGKSTLDYLAPESRELVRQARAAQLTDQQRYTLEVNLLAADGGFVPVTMVSALVSLNDKERYRVVTVTPRLAEVKPALPLRVHLTGKIRLLNLEEVKTVLGPRWEGMVERVMDSAERIITRQLLQGDVHFRTKDHGFVVCFASASEDEATFRAAAIAREIRHRLIGAGEEPETVEVSAVVAPLPAPAGAAETDHAALEQRMAEIETRLRAESHPPPGAGGFVFEPVIGREPGHPVGHYVRAQWPTHNRASGGTLLADRFEADLATLRFAAQVALDRAGSGAALFVEIDFDCFFSRQKTLALLELCRGFSPAARERIVLLLAGLTESVAQSRVLDSVQRLRPCCRAVGFAINAPELPSTEAMATVGTFVLLNAVHWESGKALSLALARISRLATGLHARKSWLMVRGIENPAAREMLREVGVNFFAVAAVPG